MDTRTHGSTLGIIHKTFSSYNRLLIVTLGQDYSLLTSTDTNYWYCWRFFFQTGSYCSIVFLRRVLPYRTTISFKYMASRGNLGVLYFFRFFFNAWVCEGRMCELIHYKVGNLKFRLDTLDYYTFFKFRKKHARAVFIRNVM